MKLREAEVLLAPGEKMGVVCKRIEVTEQTYYRWRKEYGGLRLDQSKRLLLYEDVASALDWLAKAFGFRERMRLSGPDGKVNHAEMELDDGVIMMGFSRARVPKSKAPWSRDAAPLCIRRR